jgi:multidrug efflux pump subunit AcrB
MPLASGSAPPKKPLLERMVDRVYTPIERLYVRILSWVMLRRWVVVVASVLTLASVVPLMSVVPKGFLPKSDDAQFEINVRAPEGTSLEAMKLIAERIARETRQLPHVTSTVVTIGDNNDKTPNLGKVFVKLESPETRDQSQEQLMDLTRREIVAKQPKELRIDVSDVPMFAGGGTFAMIQYEISGPNLDQLERYSNQLVERVRQIPGAVDVSSTYVTGKPEASLRINRERLPISACASRTRRQHDAAVRAAPKCRATKNGQTYAVFLRSTPEHRADLDRLSMITVPSSKLGSVPLLDVVRAEDDSGPASITRLNRRRQVMFTANLAPGAAQSEVMAAVEEEIDALGLTPEYTSAAVGQSREMQRSAQAFMVAFLLSFVFMYLVLAAQFESWLHPITILLALPLTLPFALVSLLLFGQQLDIYSMLGLLVLFGVVKKNSILQIDHTNHPRKLGKDRSTAILEANRDRLRPILMTTLAFWPGCCRSRFRPELALGSIGRPRA